MSSPSSQTTRDRRLIWVLGGALVLVVIILVIALARPSDANSNGSAPSPGAEADTQNAALPDLSRRIAADPAALGAVDAPVVLIEFADYRCPFCAVFSRETLPVLMEEYVDEGTLRIEWRDVPVFGEESFAAAVAGRAAGEQGLFWEYSAAVFAYPGRDHQALPRERLMEIAVAVGVPDMVRFQAALDDPNLVALVTSDAEEAASLGVRSTPTFLVGRVPVMGAQPIEVFREAIDAELARIGQ